MGPVFPSTAGAREAVFAAGEGHGFVWLCADHAAIAKADPAELLRALGLG